MDERDWLAKRFEEQRAHLRTVAQRMLGSTADAEDAVQEAWLRLSRTGANGVGNLGGWLTTVVARVCLDALRKRRLRETQPDEPAQAPLDPDRDIMRAESIGPALLVVLDALSPAERVAFVLHDMFDLSFEEIGPILERSAAAARQLASRARHRVRGEPASEARTDRHREIVNAFLSASRGGDLAALLAALAPDVVLRADDTALRTAAESGWGGEAGLPRELRGAEKVAQTLRGRAFGVRPALVDGAHAAVWTYEGRTRAAWLFVVEEERITEIDLVMDPTRVDLLEVRPDDEQQ